MSSLRDESTQVHPGRDGLRAQPPALPRPPALAEVLSAPRLSDRAKRLAQHLDGYCLAPDRWAAWPRVSTIADALGWTAEHGGRKRAERGFRELAEAGFLRRMTLAELAEWFDAEGGPAGLPWPKGLPRGGLRRSLRVCVLLWRLPGVAGGLPILSRCDTGGSPGLPTCDTGRLPILPRCDTEVASCPGAGGPGVACGPTPVSHGVATEVSHPWNVRSSNGPMEATTTPRACAREGDGEPDPSSSLSGISGGEGEPVAAEVGTTPEADPAREALIATIRAAAPGPENRGVRRALFGSARDLLRMAGRGGSPAPFDHVRMAIERAAASRRRRDTIESLARGILRNWSAEGWPATQAPPAPCRPAARPDPAADRRAAGERLRASIRARESGADVVARWHGLAGPGREAMLAEAGRANPHLATLPQAIRRRALIVWCQSRLAEGEAGGRPPA